MLKILFLPGAIFLLVIFFRVVIPYISTAPWKRLIDSALYHRSREEFEKSDALLTKALKKYPDQPEVYLDYFLNISDSSDIQSRFDVLSRGYERTGDVILGFFIGSTYLEHGMLEEAEAILTTSECRLYTLKRGISLLPELYYEMGDYIKAEEEFITFYGELYSSSGDIESLLDEMSPNELVMLALIRKESGGDYLSVMSHAPKTSVHSDMSWKDYRSSISDRLSSFRPASSGITGSHSEFNRRRKEYFSKRLRIIDSYC